MEIEGTHDFIAILIGKFDGCLISFRCAYQTHFISNIPEL